MSGGAKLMWVEKYRPENPDEIMGHQAIITTSIFPSLQLLSPCKRLRTVCVIESNDWWRKIVFLIPYSTDPQGRGKPPPGLTSQKWSAEKHGGI
eukprot:UN17234